MKLAHSPVRHVPDAERRARLAARHALAPGSRVRTPLDAARAVVALHATEPASVYLAVLARTQGVRLADVDKALYDDRTIVKQLAMRRTLFAFPRETLPAAWGSASARVAVAEHGRLTKSLRPGGISDPDAWLADAREQVLALLATGDGASTAEVRASIDALAGTMPHGSGAWGGDLPVAPRVLTLLGAHGDIVRGHNDGHWRLPRARWTPTATWLGEVPEPLPAAEGWAHLVGAWLARFGPGTEDDLAWWLGATKAIVRQALADVDAVPVSLDGDLAGYVLADDVDPVQPVEPWAALLPVLDPATMGWRHRDWYLDPAHVPWLFDTNGNGGTTAWWGGRVVGCWVQDAAGIVRVIPSEELDAAASEALGAEAQRLTALLEGSIVNTVYASRQMLRERLP